jgi:hypothetical protein
MTNNKQQTAVDSIIELCQKQMDNDSSIHKGVYLSIIKFCKEQITEESSYSDGYKEGFQRALKLSNLVVKNLIPTDNDKQ